MWQIYRLYTNPKLKNQVALYLWYIIFICTHVQPLSLWNFFVPLGVFLFLDIALLIPWTILFPLEWNEDLVGSCDLYYCCALYGVSDRALVRMATQRYTTSIAHVTDLVTGLVHCMCIKDC